MFRPSLPLHIFVDVAMGDERYLLLPHLVCCCYALSASARSIEVSKGTSVLLCGGEGSGKSTFLRALAGVLFPSVLFVWERLGLM